MAYAAFSDGVTFATTGRSMSGVSSPTPPHDERAARPGCQSMRSPPACASSSRLRRPDATSSSALAGMRPYIQP
jgi:hypothetical protein